MALPLQHDVSPAWPCGPLPTSQQQSASGAPAAILPYQRRVASTAGSHAGSVSSRRLATRRQVRHCLTFRFPRCRVCALAETVIAGFPALFPLLALVMGCPFVQDPRRLSDQLPCQRLLGRRTNLTEQPLCVSYQLKSCVPLLQFEMDRGDIPGVQWRTGGVTRTVLQPPETRNPRVGNCRESEAATILETRQVAGQTASAARHARPISASISSIAACTDGRLLCTVCVSSVLNCRSNRAMRSSTVGAWRVKTVLE